MLYLKHTSASPFDPLRIGFFGGRFNHLGLYADYDQTKSSESEFPDQTPCSV